MAERGKSKKTKTMSMQSDRGSQPRTQSSLLNQCWAAEAALQGSAVSAACL